MSNSPEAWEGLHRKIRERKAKEKRYQTYSCNSFKTFRRCNKCGNIYDKRDNNDGWCPLCRILEMINDVLRVGQQVDEILMEVQHRREESA